MTQNSSDARALYLGHDGKKQVACFAETLIVKHLLQQKSLRYPISRIARIVSSVAVDWNGAALALCLRHGVGIAWLDVRGGVIGTAYPRPCSRNISCSTALELMLQAPDGLQSYQNWLRARRMSVYRDWLRQHINHPLQGSNIGIHNPETIKHDWVYANQLNIEHLPAGLHMLSQAYVAFELARHDFAPQLWGPQAQAISLEEDLGRLLWAQMNLCTGNMADAIEQGQSAVSVFESWIATNASALLLHIYSLQRTAMKALDA